VLCVAAACQGVDVVAAHGDKDQQERLDAVRDFKQGIFGDAAALNILSTLTLNPKTLAVMSTMRVVDVLMVMMVTCTVL
jgi:hypothetical protein